MSFQPGANLNTVAFGNRPESVEVPHIDTRAPTTLDILYPVGKRWINTSANTAYVLTSQSSSSSGTTSTWTLLGTNGGALNTLSDNASASVTPVSNNIQIAGTSSQITTTAGSGVITLSLVGPYTPSTYTAHGVLIGEGSSSIAATAVGATGQALVGNTGADPSWTGSPSFTGSVTAGTTLTATSGAITATNGNLVLGTAGNKLSITTGSNASLGTTSAMSGTPGAVTVSTTACTTSSIILFSRATTGGTPGQVSITAQSAGSFTLTSTGNETSTFNYLIIN